MYHLVYVSHAAQAFHEADLLAILNESRVNNKKKEITGMLLYLQERFIQGTSPFKPSREAGGSPLFSRTLTRRPI